MFLTPKIKLQDFNYHPSSWIQDINSPFECRWQCPDFKAVYLKEYFETKDPIPSTNDALRAYLRAKAITVSGGLLQADWINMQGVPVARYLLKAKQNEGTRYVGVYWITFRKRTVQLKFITEEFEHLGWRDSMVAAQYFDHLNQALTPALQRALGWWQDPYDSKITTGVPMTIAEKEIYDHQFPTHPLSRLRKWMQDLEENLVMPKALTKFRFKIK